MKTETAFDKILGITARASGIIKNKRYDTGFQQDGSDSASELQGR